MAVAHHAVVGELVLHVLGGLLNGYVEPNRQIAFVGHGLEQVDRLEARSHVLKACDAVFHSVIGRKLYVLAAHTIDLFRRALGLVVGERVRRQPRGTFAQHAAQIPVSVSNHLATGRVFAVAREPGCFQSLGVHENAVTSRAAQENRILWAHRAQRVVRRQAFHARLRPQTPIYLDATRVTDVGLDIGVTYGEDHAAFCGERLRLGPIVIDRDDLAV